MLIDANCVPYADVHRKTEALQLHFAKLMRGDMVGISELAAAAGCLPAGTQLQSPSVAAIVKTFSRSPSEAVHMHQTACHRSCSNLLRMPLRFSTNR